MGHGLAVAHAERAGRFHLPLGDGLDARPEDFPHVGPVTDGHGDDGAPHGGNVDESSQGEIDVEELDQEGNTPDHLDVERGNPVDDPVLGEPAESREEADDEGEDDGFDGDLERDENPVGEEGDDVPVRVGPEEDQVPHRGDGPEEGDPPGREETDVLFQGNGRAVADGNHGGPGFVFVYSFSLYRSHFSSICLSIPLALTAAMPLLIMSRTFLFPFRTTMP